METILRVTALAAVAVTALGLVLEAIAGQFHPVEPDGLFRAFTKRGLAMELASSPDEVRRILGEEQNLWNREVMRQQQAVDFMFIAAYWLLFTLSAVFLAQRQFPHADLAAVVATLLATAGAVCDVWENVFILKITKATLDESAQPLIDQCRTAALWKWRLLFLAMLLLSAVFLGRKDWSTLAGVWFWIPGVLMAVAGVWGLAALPFGGELERALKVMSLGLFTLVIVFVWCAFRPARFLDGL